MTLRIGLIFTACLVAWMGVSPVLAAGVSCESWNTMEFFVQGGAEDISRCLKTRSPNERTETGVTPLHWAAQFSTTPAVVTALVEAGAEVNARTENGWTPLHAAAVNSTTPPAVVVSCESWNTMEFFMRGGAEDISRCLKARSPNERTETGVTPLHWAAQFSTTLTVVAALVEAGADVNVRDQDGWTPLHAAAVNSTTPAVVAALVKAGVEVNARIENGWTPLHWAAAYSATPAVVTALATAGAEVNARTEHGWTPLHGAVFSSATPAVVTALLKAGADVNVRDQDGWTPCMWRLSATETLQLWQPY